METQAVELFQPKQVSTQVTGDVATTRAAQEVQAAMVVAKKFPRDTVQASHRITMACRRVALAEVAAYAYPRGGTTVTGPSIRLAEALAQNWGNLDFGIIELEQRNGESTVMAYAWDLETNTRQTKIFTVPHERKAGKEIKALSDPRDIYELVANQGARRLRSCILGIIPGDIVESAMSECERTLKSGNKEPLIDRVKKMVTAFSEYSVTQGMIEARLGHKVEAATEQEVVNLRKIFTSIKDGAAKREDFFKVEGVATVAPETDDGDLAPQKPAAPTNPPAAGDTTAAGSPQEQLAKLVFDSGYGFAHFQRWGEESGNVPDAGSLPDFEALDGKICTRLLKAKSGLLKGLQVAKEAMA